MGGMCGSTEGLPDPFPENATREDIIKILFVAADLDGSGDLTLDEFSNLVQNSDDPDVKAKMKKIFDMADQGYQGSCFSCFSQKDEKLSEKEFVDFNLQFGGDDDAEFRNRAKVQFYRAKQKKISIMAGTMQVAFHLQSSVFEFGGHCFHTKGTNQFISLLTCLP